MTQKEEIEKLKREKNAAILAHYYVEGEVQKIADYVGDSFYLSKLATTLPQPNLILCGVSFMAESAKLLNPKKTVVMPDERADCPMAHMVDLEDIARVRKEHPEVCVVCYVNSTAQIKAQSDVCVTSSNALRIVKALPSPTVFFIPDGNLGRYIASQVPEKTFIFNDGYCHVHNSLSVQGVREAKENHPQAQVLSHPECTPDVLFLSDFIGSTSEIIDYATASEKKEFIVCTETGVFVELKEKNPDKRFYAVSVTQICNNMKRITLDKVIACLNTLTPEVTLPEDIMKEANRPLEKMLELAK